MTPVFMLSIGSTLPMQILFVILQVLLIASGQDLATEC